MYVLPVWLGFGTVHSANPEHALFDNQAKHAVTHVE